jgi:hypothetical protein
MRRDIFDDRHGFAHARQTFLSPSAARPSRRDSPAIARGG